MRKSVGFTRFTAARRRAPNTSSSIGPATTSITPWRIASSIFLGIRQLVAEHHEGARQASHGFGAEHRLLDAVAEDHVRRLQCLGKGAAATLGMDSVESETAESKDQRRKWTRHRRP